MEENLKLLDTAACSSDGEAHNEESDGGVGGKCNLQHSTCRFVILVLLCLSVFCYYYCFDMPAGLEHTIIRVMRVDSPQYELLYTFLNGPSVIIVPVMGVLLDKVLSLRVGYLISIIMMCLGQLLFALGGFVDQYWLMVVGRAIYGPAIQSGLLIVDMFAADLFQQHQISFAFGLIYSAVGLAEVVSFNLTGSLYAVLGFITNHYHRLGIVLLFGFSLCLLSLLLGVVAIRLHYMREKTLQEEKEKHGHFSLWELKHFSLSFWIFTLVPLLFNIGVISFLTITQVFFVQKYGYEITTANLVNSLIYLISMFAFPLLGLIIDWTGYKMSWGVSAVLMSLVAHNMYTFSGPDYFVPFLCTVLLALSFAIFSCSVWTFGFLLVEEHQVATAYGIAYASNNLGLALSPVFIGFIADSFGYLFVQLFFSIVLSLCLLLTTVLYMVDDIYGGRRLNMAGRWRHQVTEHNQAS